MLVRDNEVAHRLCGLHPYACESTLSVRQVSPSRSLTESSNFTPLHALPPLRTDVAVGSVWVGRPIPTLKRLREWMRLCFGHLGILASFSARIWSLDLFVVARGFGGTVLGIMIKGHRGVSESCLTTGAPEKRAALHREDQ